MSKLLKLLFEGSGYSTFNRINKQIFFTSRNREGKTEREFRFMKLFIYTEKDVTVVSFLLPFLLVT